MKKTIIYLPFIAMVILALTFTSCKKETTSTSDNSVNAKDANGVSNAVDANSSDAAGVGQIASLSGKTNGNTNWYMLCGATIVDTSSTSQQNKLVTVTYDGTTTCNGVTRSGTITFTLTQGNLWGDPNAVVTEVITNLKVTDVTTLNSFTLNGTHTITNETGGLAWELFWQPGLVPNQIVKQRDQSSNMTVKFSDGTSGSWSVDRTRTWTDTGTVVTVSVSTESTNNEDTWGTNRYGQSFSTTIPKAIKANDYNLFNSPNCVWRPYQGKYAYSDASGVASIQFGTNSAGSATGTPTTTTCGLGNSTYGYYLTYTIASYNYNFYYFGAYW